MLRNGALTAAEEKALDNIEASSTSDGVIGGAKFVEDCLAERLKKRVPHKVNPKMTFNAKISLAYKVGSIDKELRDDLHRMRNIRNRFAHNKLVYDFTDPVAQNECHHFTLIEHYLFDSAAAGHAAGSNNFLENPFAKQIKLDPRLRYYASAKIMYMLLRGPDFGEPPKGVP
jgi:hypothetical protein